MKRISLLQVNYQQGPKKCQSFYLPYTIGSIWSYAQTSDKVRQTYVLDHVVWRRDPVDRVAFELRTSDILAFSCYVWNRNYNFTLAKKIKQLNPDAFIVFGGPEMPINDKNIFQKYPFIDAVVKQEGELVFCELLENFPNITHVPGLLINQNKLAINTGDSQRIMDLDRLPSPYQTGFFDTIIADNPDVLEWGAVLETNRGCPYQCTFCDWGSLTYSKVKKFPLERVFADIEWISRNRCGWVSLADANFGIFSDRDALIADKMISCQREHGFPLGWTISWAKNLKNEVIDNVEKFITGTDQNFNTNLQISLQTLTPDVLDKIKRKNLDIANCRQIIDRARKKNLPIGTELILGLPGETLDSWRDTLYTLLELDVHQGIAVYWCQLLENSEMNQVQKQIYELETVPSIDYMSTIYADDDDCPESIDVVVATADMDAGDWMAANVEAWLLTTFHQGGLTDIMSRFLRKHNDVSYQKFYTDLKEFLCRYRWYQDQVQSQTDLIESWKTHGRLLGTEINGAVLHGWNLMYSTLMRFHSDRTLQVQMNRSLRDYFGQYQLPPDIESAVWIYQTESRVDVSKCYPYTVKLSYNLHEYIEHQADLRLIDTTVTVHDHNHCTPCNNEDLVDFMERLYFSRRKNFSRTWITTNVN